MNRSFFIVLNVLVMLLVQGAHDRLWSDQQSPFEHYNPASITGFINHLISKHEYFRAYTELKRLQEVHPGYINREKSFTTELYLLFKGKRYNEILTLPVPNAGERIRCIYTIFALDSVFHNSTDKRDPVIPDEVSVRGKKCEPVLSEMIMKRYLLLKLTTGRGDITPASDKDGSDAKSIFNDQRYRELRAYAHKRNELRRSPSLSALMGVIPGMGYMYGGNRATGIVAFMVVAVGSVLTVVAAKTDNTPLAVVFGFGTGVFYSGSVLGGYRETLRYNRGIERRTLEALAEKCELVGDREAIMECYGMRNGKNR